MITKFLCTKEVKVEHRKREWIVHTQKLDDTFSPFKIAGVSVLTVSLSFKNSRPMIYVTSQIIFSIIGELQLKSALFS